MSEDDVEATVLRAPGAGAPTPPVGDDDAGATVLRPRGPAPAGHDPQPDSAAADGQVGPSDPTVWARPAGLGDVAPRERYRPRPVPPPPAPLAPTAGTAPTRGAADAMPSARAAARRWARAALVALVAVVVGAAAGVVLVVRLLVAG